MDSFTSIRIKIAVAKRFRKYSKKHFKSHTEAMETMLDFFDFNEISPKERLSPSGRTIETNLKKRIDAVIVIIKSIEKTQTKPTLAMLEALFQVEKPEEKGLIVEKKQLKEENPFM